eukprot:8886622-Pyramimonas_sp.AAC.1
MSLGKRHRWEGGRAMAALVGHHELMHRCPDLARREVALARSQGHPGVEDLATRAPAVAWGPTGELLRGAPGVQRVAEGVYCEPAPNGPCEGPRRRCSWSVRRLYGPTDWRQVGSRLRGWASGIRRAPRTARRGPRLPAQSHLDAWPDVASSRDDESAARP